MLVLSFVCGWRLERRLGLCLSVSLDFFVLDLWIIGFLDFGISLSVSFVCGWCVLVFVCLLVDRLDRRLGLLFFPTQHDDVYNASHMNQLAFELSWTANLTPSPFPKDATGHCPRMPLAIALPPETIFHAKDVWPPVLAAAAATGQLVLTAPPPPDEFVFL